jgi:propanediol utilization protein
MPLFISERLMCDFYLLRFPAGVAVPKHKDIVQPGFEHHRINFTIYGSRIPGQRMFILGPIRRWGRFDKFRPDLYEHGLPVISSTIYMLSFGWLKKIK